MLEIKYLRSELKQALRDGDQERIIELRARLAEFLERRKYRV